MTKETVEEKPPFNVGDLVYMRSKDLKLQMHRKHVPGDLGIVMAIKKDDYKRWNYATRSYVESDKWNVTVMWQQYEGYNYYGLPRDTTQLWHTRLKKAY